MSVMASLSVDRIFGGKTDENVAAELLKTLDSKLDAYEKILSKQKYLAGDVRASPPCQFYFLPPKSPTHS